MALESTLDLLYLSLSIAVMCLTILVSILIISWIKISSQIKTTITLVKETTELVNNFAWQPLKIGMSVFSTITNFFKK
jgi:hypothetical protein